MDVNTPPLAHDIDIDAAAPLPLPQAADPAPDPVPAPSPAPGPDPVTASPAPPSPCPFGSESPWQPISLADPDPANPQLLFSGCRLLANGSLECLESLSEAASLQSQWITLPGQFNLPDLRNACQSIPDSPTHCVDPTFITNGDPITFGCLAPNPVGPWNCMPAQPGLAVALGPCPFVPTPPPPPTSSTLTSSTSSTTSTTIPTSSTATSTGAPATNPIPHDSAQPRTALGTLIGIATGCVFAFCALAMVAWVVVRYGRYAGQRSVQHKFERINISSSNSNSSPSSHSSRRASNTVQPRMATAYSRHMSHLDRTRPQPESVLLLPTTCHVPVPTPATAPTTTTTTRLTPTPRLPPRPMMLPPGTPRPPPMMPTSILSPTASTASFHNLSTLLSIDPHRRHPGTPRFSAPIPASTAYHAPPALTPPPPPPPSIYSTDPVHTATAHALHVYLHFLTLIEHTAHQAITHLATSPTSTSHLATREHILAVDFPHALPATLSRGARIRAALVQSLTSLLTHTDPSVANATNVAQSMSALGCFVTLGKAHELVAAGRRVVAGVQAAAACMAEREPGAGAGAGEAWVEWLARPRVGQWFVEYVEGDTASARGMVDYCLKMDDNDCERGNGRQPKRVVHSVVAPGLAVPFPADGDRVWLVPARVWTRPAAAL